jgi:hypothetical protein
LINSRKSLLNGIGVSSLSESKEDGGPLLRGHFGTGKRIGRIRFLKTAENTDDFLHSLILRWFFDSDHSSRRPDYANLAYNTGRWRKMPNRESAPSSGNVFADLNLPNADDLLAKAELATKIIAEVESGDGDSPRVRRLRFSESTNRKSQRSSRES